MQHKVSTIQAAAAIDPLHQSPILKTLQRMFGGMTHAIDHMREQAPSDETLRQFVAFGFGLYGGGSLQPEGWYEYAGGAKPRLTIQDKQHSVVQELKGPQLIEAFRLVFNIPAGKQLSLF